MREVTLADFRKDLGKDFDVAAGGGRLRLRLAQAQELPPSGRRGGSFRLEFSGPFQPVLPQGSYPFVRGQERMDIFIVPVGQDTAGIRYEAIFF